MIRRVRELEKWLAFQSYTKLDRFGIHILPKHYYSPVPDRTWLLKNKHLWTGRASMHDVQWDLDEQLRWLESICGHCYHEVQGLDVYNACSSKGPGFGPIESQVLHCYIREKAPARIIEIGSGASTCCMLNAVNLNRKDGKQVSKITCIEPFPRQEFRSIDGIHHIETMCQEVPGEVFSQLQTGDLLLIDSSHTLKVGSDVVRIYLDIIPSLAAGVTVHFHDIFLPYLYPRLALEEFFGWQETTLLLALLTGNGQLKVLSCMSALHYDRKSRLESLLSDYRPQFDYDGLPRSKDLQTHFPSSLWLTKLDSAGVSGQSTRRF